MRYPDPMSRRDGDAECAACGMQFGYKLVHNGFNNTAYAYCEKCGKTAFFSFYSPKVPSGARLDCGPISSSIEPLVHPCDCGGRFRGSATPRCPYCRQPLSAELAAHYIERNRGGWRWQNSWKGVYAIVVEDSSIDDPWLAGAG